MIPMLHRAQLDFVEVFLKNRGIIREVERELGVSYPTVRARLDEVLDAIGFNLAPGQEDGRNAREALMLPEAPVELNDGGGDEQFEAVNAVQVRYVPMSTVNPTGAVSVSMIFNVSAPRLCTLLATSATNALNLLNAAISVHHRFCDP